MARGGVCWAILRASTREKLARAAAGDGDDGAAFSALISGPADSVAADSASPPSALAAVSANSNKSS